MTERTPEQHMEAAFHARIAGTMGQDEYLQTVERWAPLRGTVQQPAPTQEQAQQRVKELRELRADGKITQEEFFRQNDALGPIASPEVSTDAELLADIDRMMAPARYAEEYRLAGRTPVTTEEQARDSALRQGLLDAQIPAHMGGQLLEMIEHASRPAATDRDRQYQMEASRDALIGKWGERYESNAQLVQEFLLRAAEKSSLFADLIDNRSWVFTDSGINNALLAIAQAQQRARG